MNVLEIDIPYKILWEEVSYDMDFRTIRINRAYEIPKPKLFESPNKYIEIFKEYNNRRWAEEGFEAYTDLTGWKDANCRSYGMTILIHLYGQ